MKRTIRRIVSDAVRLTDKTRIGRFLNAQILSTAFDRTQTVHHGKIDLRFCVPNYLNQFRADTFETKEPDTLNWIDAIPQSSVLWDIGANVGLYSCYAAKRDIRVIAFEPSPFNLECLARNIALNQSPVTVVPLPLTDVLGVSTLNMSQTEWGASLSTFGQSYGHDGKPLVTALQFATVGVSMLDAVDLLHLPMPDYIKMDVDGIEHLILRGGDRILRHTTSVLVEVNESFPEQAEGCAECLIAAGLELREKRSHADFGDPHTFNQIWARHADTK